MSESISAAPPTAPQAISKSSGTSPMSSPGNSEAGSPRDSGSPAFENATPGELLSSPESNPASPPPQPPLLQNIVQVLLKPAANSLSNVAPQPRPRPAALGPPRRPSFGLGFLSSLSSSIRGAHQPAAISDGHFMSNSPTIANLSNFGDETDPDLINEPSSVIPELPVSAPASAPLTREATTVENFVPSETVDTEEESGRDKDGCYSVRLTPIIDHLSTNTGLYFSPIIRRIKPTDLISIGRYTEKNKSAAHAPQGSSAPIVFKSKVVSRTHAMFQCNEEGLWFLKDCKSSSGTFLNNIRLSQASQELTLWPLIDGDVVQLGLDYRGGTEEVYRCVKMRCEFNRSWQRKVNQFNLDIHKKLKNLGIESKDAEGTDEFSECAICLLKLEPCQALFISPCSHSWHYKCIRPIIIKSYPQFYCPNCRSMCDLETDIEDE